MKVRVETQLDAPIDDVWRALQTPRLLKHVASPLIIFRLVGGGAFPDAFADGRVQVWMWMFGIVPFGRQWIDVSRPMVREDVRQIRDNGSGDLVQRWDHLITIRPLSASKTHYQDEVEIKAGLLTPVVWMFAAVFYRWRQHRWRGLVRRGFQF